MDRDNDATGAPQDLTPTGVDAGQDFVAGESFEAPPEDLTPEELTHEGVAGSSPPPPPPPMGMAHSGGSRLRKYILLGGLILIFFLIFFGIAKLFINRVGGGAKESENINLTYWGLWQPPEVFKTVLDDYSRQNPNVTVEYIQMEPIDYREKLVQRTLNGTGPDIFRFHNMWVPMLKDEALSALPKDIMTDNEFDSTFYPVAQKDLRVGDSYVGIPLHIDGLVLVYNDTLFKQAGIQTSPTTWIQVIDAASEIVVKDGESIITAGIAMGTAENVDFFSDILGWMLLQNGASINDLSSQVAVNALEEYRSFAEPPNNLWSDAMPNSTNAFLQGQVGMIIVPSWEITALTLANPDLQLKVAPLPVLDQNNKVALASYWVEGVSKASRHQSEAWKLLKYLSSKETMAKLYEAQVESGRPFGEPYSRVDLAGTLVQTEYIGPVLTQAQYMSSAPTISRTHDNGINDEINAYLKDAVNATVNSVSYAEAMRTAHNGVTQVLQKYGVTP